MKLNQSGLQSPRTLLVIFSLALLSMLATSFTGKAAAPTPVGINSSENWTTTIPITCPGGADVIEVEWLLPPAANPIVVSAAADGQEIFVELSSSAIAGIAPGSSIARIIVSNADGTCTKSFLLKMEGGGMIIAIDEF